MDILFNYLESKYLDSTYENHKLEFCKSANQLIIRNSFYSFRLKKTGFKYVLFRFWKRGVLAFIYKKQNNDMNNIYDDINCFAKNNNLIIEEMFYNNSAN